MPVFEFNAYLRAHALLVFDVYEMELMISEHSLINVSNASSIFVFTNNPIAKLQKRDA